MRWFGSRACREWRRLDVGNRDGDASILDMQTTGDRGKMWNNRDCSGCYRIILDKQDLSNDRGQPVWASSERIDGMKLRIQLLSKDRD
jgi:hypothetical protein